MITNLDQLLESIDPDRTLDRVSAQVDEALNSFRVKSGIIEDWQGFRAVLAKFFRHVENVVLQIRPSFSGDPDFDWGGAATC